MSWFSGPLKNLSNQINFMIDDAVKITSESHDPRTLEIATCKKKEVT